MKKKERKIRFQKSDVKYEEKTKVKNEIKLKFDEKEIQ